VENREREKRRRKEGKGMEWRGGEGPPPWFGMGPSVWLIWPRVCTVCVAPQKEDTLVGTNVYFSVCSYFD